MSGQPVDEIEEEQSMDIDEFEGDDEEFMDMGGLLTSLMATDDGDTVCTALVNINNTLAQLSKHMETQNKILVKIVTQLNK
jgi:hypothetical protein